jgi:hypothetical protein
MTAAIQAAQAASQAISDGWLGAPWTFWSGLLGSGVTAAVAIGTLLVSNKANIDRQGQQLAHDAREKREDRKLSIRREVYAAAIEASHGLLAAVGGLTSRPMEMAPSDVDALQTFLKANAKIWLVADSEAAHLSRDLASEFSEFYLREKQIAHERSELLRFQMKFYDAKSRNAFEEQEPVAKLMIESENLIADLERVQGEARQAVLPLAFESYRTMFSELRGVQRSLCRLVSALRAELGLARDDDQFMAQLREMERRSWAAMSSIGGFDSVEMPAVEES